MSSLLTTSGNRSRESEEHTEGSTTGQVSHLSLERTKHEAPSDAANLVDSRHEAQKNGREILSLTDDGNLDYENITENLNHMTSTELKTSSNDQMINLLNTSVDNVLNESGESKEHVLLTRQNVSSSEIPHKLDPQYDNKYVNRERNGRFKMLEALQDLRNTDIVSRTKIDHDLHNHTLDKSNLSSHGIQPLAMEDSIILKSLGLNNSQGLEVVSKLSILVNSNRSGLPNNDEQELEEESLPIKMEEQEEDYLDYSNYADYYNDPVEDTEDNVTEMLEVIKFRDYPMGDGYVRIPVYVPGLEIVDVPEVPQLWSAREAFMRQVGSKLYMFIPSAILGFLIGLLIWIIILACIRIFGVVKKSIARLFPSEKVDALDLKVMYAMSGNEDTGNKNNELKMAKIYSGSIRRSGIGPCYSAEAVKLNKLVQETDGENSCAGDPNDEKLGGREGRGNEDGW